MGGGKRLHTRLCDFIGAQLGVGQATRAGSFQGAAALALGGWALQRAEDPAKSSALPARARRRYGEIGGAEGCQKCIGCLEGDDPNNIMDA